VLPNVHKKMQVLYKFLIKTKIYFSKVIIGPQTINITTFTIVTLSLTTYCTTVHKMQPSVWRHSAWHYWILSVVMLNFTNKHLILCGVVLNVVMPSLKQHILKHNVYIYPYCPFTTLVISIIEKLLTTFVARWHYTLLSVCFLAHFRRKKPNLFLPWLLGQSGSK
jgi:hypothetical protein